MQKIIFKEDGHQYYRESDGMSLMSMSAFGRHFTPEFRGLHLASKRAAEVCLGAKAFDEAKKAWYAEKKHMLMPEFIEMLETKIKNKKTYKALIEKTLADWGKEGEDTAEDGKQQHGTFEQLMISAGEVVNPYNGEVYPVRSHGKKPSGDNETVVGSLLELEWGAYPEMLLWYLFPEPVFSISMNCWICGIAGQSDLPFIDKQHNIYITDLKTNKSLSDFGINWPNFGYEYHSGPWADMRYTKLSKYKIQLPGYGWLAESHGLKVKDLRILHKGTEIPIQYFPEKVEAGVTQVFLEGL